MAGISTRRGCLGASGTDCPGWCGADEGADEGDGGGEGSPSWPQQEEPLQQLGSLTWSVGSSSSEEAADGEHPGDVTWGVAVERPSRDVYLHVRSGTREPALR